MTSIGAGTLTVPQENRTAFFKAFWASTWLNNTTLTAARASALLFYARVFTTIKPGFQSELWIGHALVGACNLFFCSPTQTYWDPSVKGLCRSYNNFYLAAAATSSAIDLYILLLLMPLLWSLKLKATRKAMITLLFVLSYMLVFILAHFGASRLTSPGSSPSL